MHNFNVSIIAVPKCHHWWFLNCPYMHLEFLFRWCNLELYVLSKKAGDVLFKPRPVKSKLIVVFHICSRLFKLFNHLIEFLHWFLHLLNIRGFHTYISSFPFLIQIFKMLKCFCKIIISLVYLRWQIWRLIFKLLNTMLLHIRSEFLDQFFFFFF